MKQHCFVLGENAIEESWSANSAMEHIGIYTDQSMALPPPCFWVVVCVVLVQVD